MRIAHSPSTATTTYSTIAPAVSVRVRFLMVVALAALADLLTKALATSLLGDGDSVRLSSRLAFMLVYNTGGAGGVMIGPYTWALNILVTVVAIVMIARVVTPLAAVDGRATLALGLVTGGAAGNLASMLAGPAGVADFVAVRLSQSMSIVLNVADLMLWSGAVMLLPVVVRLVGLVWAERTQAR